MKNNRWIAVVLFVVLFAGGIAVFYANKTSVIGETPKLTVGIGTWIGFGKAVLAKEKGLFEGVDVDLKIIDDPNALLGGLTSGSLDVAQNSIDQFVLFRLRDVGATLLVVTDESSGGDGIVGGPGIGSIAALEGKRVTYTRGPASEYLLAAAMRAEGMAQGAVERLEFDDPGQTLAAYSSGSADAIAIWEPFLSQAMERDGSTKLATSADFPETVLGVLMVSPQSQGKSVALERFLDGWFRAEEYLNDNREDAFAAMAKGFSVSVEDLEIMIQGAKLITRNQNKDYFSGGGQQLLRILKPASEYWSEKLNLSDADVGKESIDETALQYFSD